MRLEPPTTLGNGGQTALEGKSAPTLPPELVWDLSLTEVAEVLATDFPCS